MHVVAWTMFSRCDPRFTCDDRRFLRHPDQNLGWLSDDPPSLQMLMFTTVHRSIILFSTE